MKHPADVNPGRDAAPRHPSRLIVGISGASGIVYGVRLLEVLRELRVETHLVLTKAGELTASHEHPLRLSAIRALASRSYHINDIGASIASGSFRTLGMIVAPCSMNTLAEIASGLSSNLLTRAADVCLKERRRVALVVRETPLHAGHLRSMLKATELGAVIAPPVPAFYAKPASLDDVVNYGVGRLLDLFGLETDLAPPWSGVGQPTAPADLQAGVSA